MNVGVFWLIYLSAVAAIFGAWYPLNVRLCDGSRELDVSRTTAVDASLAARADTSRITGDDASPAAGDDASPEVLLDASSPGPGDASRASASDGRELAARVAEIECLVKCLAGLMAQTYRAENLPVPENLRSAAARQSSTWLRVTGASSQVYEPGRCASAGRPSATRSRAPASGSASCPPSRPPAPRGAHPRHHRRREAGHAPGGGLTPARRPRRRTSRTRRRRR